jgi:hypothetical protein
MKPSILRIHLILFLSIVVASATWIFMRWTRELPLESIEAVVRRDSPSLIVLDPKKAGREEESVKGSMTIAQYDLEGKKKLCIQDFLISLMSKSTASASLNTQHPSLAVFFYKRGVLELSAYLLVEQKTLIFEDESFPPRTRTFGLNENQIQEVNHRVQDLTRRESF